MILNLRGGSGSGKSYPGFRLLDEYGPPVDEIHTTEYFGRKKPKLIAQILPGDLCLAGRYTMGASTRLGKGKKGYSGGVDGFYPIAELNRMIQDLCDQYEHVLFESLMISGTHQRWEDFAKLNESKGRAVVFATLDTPLDLQVERVMTRNGGREVQVEDMRKHRRQVHRCAKKFNDSGCHSFMVDHTQSYEQVRGMFIGAGWNPQVGSPREAVPDGAPST